jgi:outer membrane receptor protein involved in Fe transport
VYASWAQGFRLGRPSTGLPSATCDQDNNGLLDGTDVSIASTRQVDSDFLDNYEVGGKFAFMDRRVIIDSAVYYIKWKGLPISALASACNLGYTANVGGATSRGIELQASVLAREGVRIDIGAGYTDPELSKPGLGAPQGARLPGSPKFNANLSAQYDFNVYGYESFVRADSMYSGAFYGDLLQTPSLEAGNYVKVDARAGVMIDSLSIELFVRNLTNRDAYTFRGVFPDTPLFGYRLQPRTVGLQLGYSFE